MERIELSKEIVLMACGDKVAKSRFYKSTFIHRESGSKMTLNEALTYLSFNTRSYAMYFWNKRLVKGDKTEIYLDAIKDLEYLTGEDCKRLVSRLPRWAFFENIFKFKKGEKILVTTIFNQYASTFGIVSRKEFYNQLNFWAQETCKDVTYKNVRLLRKVIVS